MENVNIFSGYLIIFIEIKMAMKAGKEIKGLAGNRSKFDKKDEISCFEKLVLYNKILHEENIVYKMKSCKNLPLLYGKSFFTISLFDI